MLSAWSQHLAQDSEAKKKFEDMVKGSKLLTDRLQEILDQLEKALEHEELSDKTFDTPNWDYKIARNLGRKETIRRIKFILDVNPPKEQ